MVEREKLGVPCSVQEALDKLLALDGKARDRLRAMVLLWSFYGFGRVVVVATRRTLDEQRRIYGRGRSEFACAEAKVPAAYADPDRMRVSWCRPEDSEHVRGMAADIDWGAYTREQFEACLRMAENMGVRCGARWKARDDYHFEVGGEG